MTTLSGETIQQLDDARAWARSGPHGHVINGVAEPVGGGRLRVVDPGSGEVIAEIADGTVADVDRAVQAAVVAFKGWRATVPAERHRVLNAVADAVEAHVQELTALEALNCCKPMIVAAGEIGAAADVFRFLGGAARALQAPAPQEYAAGHFSMLVREPVGVVGAITPWNYPLLTAVFKLGGAIAAGNSVVLKPSELTPLTTLRFMEIVAGILPPGILNIVLGTGPVVGSALSGHPSVSLVSLTGSVASGQHVLEDAKRTLKTTHLELGGKAPVIVFDDADLDAAVATVRFAGYWNTGQECGAATRVLVSRAIAETFTNRLVDAVATIKVGRTTDGDDVEVGPLISGRHLSMVADLVDRARADGARVAIGGARIEGEGFFFQPTVIVDVSRGSEIAQHEIFGPVVTIETFEDESEVIELANAVAYGLSGSVWTKDVGRALRVSGALDFGTVWVNAHLVLANEMPWGGFKASGHGRELSILSLEDFTRTKHVMIATGAA